MADFFAQQDAARRKTRVLLLLLGGAVIALAFALYVLLVLVVTRGGLAFAVSFWQPELLVLAFCVTLIIVVGASAARTWSLRGGGRVVAEMLGGVEVPLETRDPLERRLINVVEEMAIASGMPMPQVYVLREPGINAFAAGFRQDDAAIAVTRGALRMLHRDELQGVVAHEFSHILHGDMRLNIRLMGVIFGILCIAMAGKLLWRFAAFGGARRRGDGRSGAFAVALLAAGLGLVVIGSVGRFFARWIKAAVSRQREFLADASATQFTRNPTGLAGALKKIGGFPSGSQVAADRSEEASHFFFADVREAGASTLGTESAGLLGLWGMGRMFATHPPLRERILRLDPGFSGAFPESSTPVVPPQSTPFGLSDSSVHNESTIARHRARVKQHAHPAGATAEVASAVEVHIGKDPRTPVHRASGDAVRALVGRVDAVSTAVAHDIVARIPPELHRATGSSFAAEAVVFALLLQSHDAAVDVPDGTEQSLVPTSRRSLVGVREEQLRGLAAFAGEAMVVEVLALAAAVHKLDPYLRLPLVELCAPALRNLTLEQRRRFSQALTHLMEADGRLEVFEYVVAHTLRRRMRSRQENAVKRLALRRTLPSLGTVQDELVLLLSVLAHEGHDEVGVAQQAYRSGCDFIARSGLLRNPLPAELLPQGKTLLPALGIALERMAQCTGAVREQIVGAAIHTALADGTVRVAEAELLRAICDSLSAPIPPFVLSPETHSESETSQHE